MKSNKTRVAVIGAGNMGKNHLRTLASLDSVELLAVADINPESKELAETYNIKYFKDYKKMLSELKPDAVTIVVPTPLHYSIGKDVITKKIHCLIEKPIASTPEEGDELIILAEKNKVVFTVGHIERYNPMIQKLKKLIDKEEIGEISSIIVKRVGGFPGVEPKTDVIIDLAVHDIEIINYLLNQQPTSISGHGSKTLHSTKVDSAEILMKYDGASGFVQANWITPVKIRTIAVTGSTGYVEGNYITQELTYYKHTMKPVNDGFKNFVVTLGEPEKYFISDTPKEPLRIELETFVKAIQTNNISKSNGLVQPIAARRALQIALDALS